MIKQTNLGLMVVAILVVLIGAGSVAADLTDGLVAHWKLNETSGTIAEDSAGSNDGTLLNGPVWTAGQIGGALDFDGINDIVDCGSSFGAVVGSNTKTILAWAKSAKTDYSTEGRILTLYRYNGYSGFSIGTSGQPAVWRALYSTPPKDSAYLTSASPLSVNQWTHIALVQNGTNVYLYINGILEDSASNAINPFFGSPNATIGAWHYTLSPIPELPFDGTIDDVRIYDRALSDSEVRQLYRGDLLGLEVVGPDKVAENSQAQYNAIAFYERADIDVTNSADWFVEPNDNCGIAAGLLTTEPIDLPLDLTIYAEYNEDGSSVEAEKDVEVFAICPSGSALEFDGINDYVDIDDDDFLTLTDITLMAWVKSNDKSDYKHIISNYHIHSSAQFYHLYIEAGTGKGRFQVDDGSGTPPHVVGTTDITDGQWHHIAGVRDAASDLLRIYVDGIPENSISDTTAPVAINPMNDLWIGGQYHFTSRYFNGLIDEVAIYNKALSSEGIWQLMHTRPDSEPNLVGYWDFDEGSGQEAADSSGNGNDGTLGSGPGIDNSDPNWVDSVPPVGICSVEGIVERNLLNVLGMKNDVLDILDEAIGKEEALWEYMDTVFKDRDFGNTSKGDVVKAKQKILSAIQREEQAETSIGQSLEKLNDALDALDIELNSNGL